MISDNAKVLGLLQSILPKDRIKGKFIDRIARAPDAGFYYLVPQAIVRPVSEDEIRKLFDLANRHKIPLTFRTGGTSLSGQAITDGILVDLTQHWTKLTIEDNGKAVRVQPGITGAMVNLRLSKYRRKIGPDPASISAAMIGGIIANNASGMCCGVSKNSYHTVKSIKFMLPSGLVYATEQQDDYKRFKDECPDIYQKLISIRDQIANDDEVYKIIRKKYLTKNTVGYSINAFIDYQEPLDILAHLLVGSEGTLGFIAEAVMLTLPDYPVKLTSLFYFPDIYEACKAIIPLTKIGAEMVELMDRPSLRSVEHIPAVPEQLKLLPPQAAALLVEFQGYQLEELKFMIDAFNEINDGLNFLFPPVFTADKSEQALLWKIRKGMFPTIGAVRKSGETVILEDIAFPVESLGDAILSLQQLFIKHDYLNGIIFGHAKDGNIHFVITQTFSSAEEIARYDNFIKDVVELVIKKYNGALKAEHGTGRNMAPFVETEWGTEIYQIMKEIKVLLDPNDILNPGVIINKDPTAHIGNLKIIPPVEDEVDKCIECGFCEHMCPSRNITLTPRQRIVARRGLAMLKNQGETKRYKQLLSEYQYEGLDTCAVDGLCAVNCPVDINTATLVKRLRSENHSPVGKYIALKVAQNLKTVSAITRQLLFVGVGINKLFGPQTMRLLTGNIKKVIRAFPVWSNQLRPAALFQSPVVQTDISDLNGKVVVYLPACINRVMGNKDKSQKSLIDTFISVADKAGIGVIIPDEIKGMCCGQIFSSKGFNDAYGFMANQTVDAVWKASHEGRLAIVLDVSSCTQTLQQCEPVLTPENKEKFKQLNIIDSVSFLADFILPNISVKKKVGSIVLHPVCSLQKMGLSAVFQNVARSFAEQVTIPENAGCCGMAGDRGFLFPELTRSATAPESAEVKCNHYDGYFSSGKTCEIAMSDVVKENYESILFLADKVI